MFLDHRADLEEVYKVYCQNHDDAITLLESYEKDGTIQRHILECLEKLRYGQSCWEVPPLHETRFSTAGASAGSPSC